MSTEVLNLTINISPPGKSTFPGYVAVTFMMIGIIFAGWLIQVSTGLHKMLYDSEFYRCSLQEVKLEDEFRVMLIEYAIMESDRTISIALSDIPMIKNALASAIDEEWLKEEIDKNLDNAVDFIFGDREKFVVKVPLEEKQPVFEEEMRREWEAYPGHERLEELGMEVPDPTLFIKKIDLPSEITIKELSSLTDFGQEEQTAITGIRSIESVLQITPYLLIGLLLSFSLVSFGVILGLKLFGSGLFLSGLSLYLLWHKMESTLVGYLPKALEPYGLSFLADHEVTASIYNCAQAGFTDIHVVSAGFGLFLIALAYLIQLALLIVRKR